MLKIFVLILALLSLLPPPAFAAEKTAKNGILLVAFGTSMPEATKAIDSLVNATKAAFPDTEIRIAYTSNIIRRKLKREQNIEIPTPPEALAKMNDDGFTNVYVQPMHVIPGEEYGDLKGVVDAFAALRGKYGFGRIVLGRPLLFDQESCEVMAGILARRFEKTDASKVVVLMGHGSPHTANALYGALQLALDRISGEPARFFIGTVEAAPTFSDVLSALKKTSYQTLVLSPFMIVAGDHASNDLAGADDPESWLSMLKAQGFKIETELTGIGEYPEVVELFVGRVRELMQEAK